jgi:hypothetical protein
MRDKLNWYDVANQGGALAKHDFTLSSDTYFAI